MTNTFTVPGLMGTILTALPGNQTYTSDYIVEAQIQQPATSADFGISFRNQPGSQQGIYTFFLHKDGTWHDYVYDNVQGKQTQIASGITSINFHGSLLMTVIAHGASFTFYINGTLVGNAYDETYASGTVGISVDTGGTVVVRKFSVYAIA